jgi:short-subunit dehydrogenase
VARSADAIEKLAADLGGTAHPADLCDVQQVATLIHHVEDEAGPVDVLVNNAGVAYTGALDQQTPDQLRDTYQLNLVTPAQLCRQAIPRMLHRGGGHLVNVSSMAGVIMFPGMTVYGSTKAGLTHFTAGLRADLKKLPIGTTVVELGPIPTDMLDQVDEYGPTEKSFQRVYRLRLAVDVSREVVATQVVDAVEKGRRHVRIPKRGWLFPALVEAPRRFSEVILTGVKPRA